MQILLVCFYVGLIQCYFDFYQLINLLFRIFVQKSVIDAIWPVLLSLVPRFTFGFYFAANLAVYLFSAT